MSVDVHSLEFAVSKLSPAIAEIGRYTDYLWQQCGDLPPLPPLPAPRRKADREKWVRSVRRAIAKRLNRAQSLAIMLIHLRGKAISGGKLAEVVAEKVRSAARVSSTYEAVARRQASGMFRQSQAGESVRIKSCAAALAQPTLDDAQIDSIRAGSEVLRQWADLCADLDALAKEVRAIAFGDDSTWASIKPYPNESIPYNSRRACSLLLALADGSKTPNLPSEHSILGYTTGAIPPVQRVEFRACDTNHKPPSLKEGREMWNSPRRNHTKLRPADLRESLRASVSRKLAARACFRAASDGYQVFNRNRTKLLTDCRWGKIGDDIGARIVDKITGGDRWRERVNTLVTGRPIHIAGDDYACPVLYWGDYDNGATTGFVLLRRNWPSSIHVPALESPAAISARLDTASSYHFRNRREAALAKLSARQRLARLVRSARAVPQFSIDDSYAVGNCVPGTSAWIVQLGLSQATPAVSGRELAKRWRSASYPQPERFGSVVMHLVSKLPQSEQPAPSVSEMSAALESVIG